MSRKITYFDLPGYVDAIRYMLHYSGMKFEDVRYQLKDWPIKEVKDATPYGQLPVYEEDGRTINQSMAIARYVASQTGLLPSDPWEQAKLDAAVLNVYDFFKAIYSTATEKDEEKKKALQAETVAFYFSKFERDLKAGNGYFGGKLSWADFVLVGCIAAQNLFLKKPVEKDYPTVLALVTEIRSLKGVKEYVAKHTYDHVKF
ncbi:hypothetical protein ABMA27_001627 [Loxostege sticticalis]|uniref:glutathione transferase n=1 Tax=Loxostege sticticalis TaxID=481309 RepID=A0ABR3HZ51_LOXSC